MKKFVIRILTIIVLVYSSELKTSEKYDDSDDDYLHEVSQWGPLYHEGDRCPNQTFRSLCVICLCDGTNSALCGRDSCYIPPKPLPVNRPCGLGTKFCVGPIQCICHATNSSLATCDMDKYC